ncbi:MAG: hypothetical protein CL568_09815 [Alphaproteobacteria bacterium]|nr:hypothetical protein [Alphaproteobacteria bacterium]PPR12624.1 MAG: hypothetical protein CFH42_01981 [Alphaproteobacteria bacterium MarineAlpha12_Bin1]
MNNKRLSKHMSDADHIVNYEKCPKRIRGVFADNLIVDSSEALILYETNHVPIYYFPRDNVIMDHLIKTKHKTYCPYKGDASYFSISVNGKTSLNAVWSYEDPVATVNGIKDYVAFYWNKVDQWYEEDEEVFVHARSPYVRIDILDSSRTIRIELDGKVLAESQRSRFLFETNLPPRFYIQKNSMKVNMLPSNKETYCPYKGKASYYSIEVGDKVYEDILWCYKNPVLESSKIKGYVCFFNEKVDIYIDGNIQIRPQSKWS